MILRLLASVQKAVSMKETKLQALVLPSLRWEQPQQAPPPPLLDVSKAMGLESQKDGQRAGSRWPL